MDVARLDVRLTVIIPHPPPPPHFYLAIRMRIRGSETHGWTGPAEGGGWGEWVGGEGLGCHGSQVTPGLQRKWCKTPCPFHVLLNRSLQWLSGDIQFWRPCRCVPNLCGITSWKMTLLTWWHQHAATCYIHCVFTIILNILSEHREPHHKIFNIIILVFIIYYFSAVAREKIYIFWLASLAMLPNIETWVLTPKLNNK